MLIPESVIPADRYGIIYVVTNRVNGKQYVGQTVRLLKKRWKNHLTDSRTEKKRYNSILCNAITAYGEDLFQVETIDWAGSQMELDHKEIWWIAFLNTSNREEGYNILLGGRGHGRMLPEVVARIADKKRGRPLPPTHPFLVKGRVPHNKGKRMSESSKQKCRDAMIKRMAKPGWVHPQRGIKLPAEQIEKMRRWRTGIPTYSLRSPVICVETGMRFDFIGAAAKWLGEKTGLRACESAIGVAKSNPKRTVGGYHWISASTLDNS